MPTQDLNQRYRRLEVVGRGKFGTVYKGMDLNTKKLVGIKVLNLDTEENEVKEVQKEIQFLATLTTVPNVTHYYGSYLNGHDLWIIMDYCAGGSVRTLLRPGPLDELHIAVIARELLSALHFVHQSGVIHRDIKAANILITKEGNVQLCDFGVAAQLNSTAVKRTTMAGTPYWMAPEVITEGATYNVKADIWSFGITIYEMVTGNPPYSDKDAMRALQMITHHEPPRLEGRQYSAALKEFVAMCLEEKPNLRPSAGNLLKSKFIRNYKQTPTSSLKEVIARYLTWRERRNSSSASSIYVEDEEPALSGDETYDVKWDFDSLKSAEYIVENGIDVDDIPETVGNTFSSPVTQTPTTFRTLATMNTSPTMLATPSGTLSGTNVDTSNAPRSLLKLFEDGDESESEYENTTEEPKALAITSPIVEMPSVPEMPVPIEIPTMDALETKSQQRARAATVAIDHTPSGGLPKRSNSSADFLSHEGISPQVSRRPTMTTGHRTPSPKKSGFDLPTSPLRTPKNASATHMKPLLNTSKQPLLQPINTVKANTVGNIGNTQPQTAPALSSSELQQMHGSTLARSQSQLNTKQQDKLNQFGVNINLAQNIPMAMTPVTDKSGTDESDVAQTPPGSAAPNTSVSSTTFFHSHHAQLDHSPQQITQSTSNLSNLSGASEDTVATLPSQLQSSQMLNKLSDLQIADVFDTNLPEAVLEEPVDEDDEKDAMADNLAEMIGKFRSVLDVVVDQLS